MSVSVRTNDLETHDLNIATVDLKGSMNIETVDLYSDLTFLVSGLKGDKGDRGEQGIQGIQGEQGIQGVKGDKGDTGDIGYSIKAVCVYRDTFSSYQWKTFGTIGRSEPWNNTADKIEGMRVGDIFLCYGNATDTGVGYLLLYKFTGVSANRLLGVCVACIELPKGEKGDKGDTGLQGEQGVGITKVVSNHIGTNTQIELHLSNDSAYTFLIPDGKQGEQGVSGYTPKKGVDYFTKEDIDSLPFAKPSNIPTKVSQLTNDSNYTTEKYVDDKIAEVETFKTPNITIYGQPTINNGQISNFSTTNYAQFPFMVNFQNRPFNIHICLTTSNDITTQQNIFDSRFGLAFAIRNKHLICAYSTNGTSWESELIGIHELKANTTYYINLKWQDNKFEVYLSEDHETYLQDIEYSVNATPASKQIIIGKDLTNNYIFSGIVNLNYCYLTIGEELVWQGMDDVGLSTRLATDLSNIDDEGVEKIKEISKPCFYYFVKGDGTTAGKWHATIHDITEYYEGLTILLYLNVEGAATVTLQVNDLDEVPCYLNAKTTLTTQYVAGCIIPLTYIEEDGIGKFKIADYNINTTYEAVNGIFWDYCKKLSNLSINTVAASIIGVLGNGEVCVIHRTNTIGTTKKASLQGFDLYNYGFYYCNTAHNINEYITPIQAFNHYRRDARYIFNSSTYTLYNKSYLKFTKGEDGLFYFYSPNATTEKTFSGAGWWCHIVDLPNDDDSKQWAETNGVYFYEVGMHYAGTNNRNITLNDCSDLWYVENNEWKKYKRNVR